MKRMEPRHTPRMGQIFFTVLCMLTVVPASAGSAIPDGPYNLWLVEHVVPQAPLYRARIAGVAGYGHYQSGATLAFNCRRDTPGVNVELALDPKPLDFDTDPYEGPDAKAHGPIAITSANDPVARLKVSGWYGDGGPFDTGTPFIFAFSPEPAQMQAWTVAAARGRTLRIEVPAAKGGAPLSVQFRWPDNDAAFLRVVAPCLSKASGSH